MTKRYLVCFAVLALVVLPVIAVAAPLGNARLTNVTPVTSACVSGPTGNSVQFWDVERGEIYTLTLSNVTDCANGGTDPTINVRVNNWSTPGFRNAELVAYYVSPGVYQFDFYMPDNAVCTFPIFYCTTPGDGNSGFMVRRNDGAGFQAHLRAAFFDAGCTNPDPIYDGTCGTVPVEPSSWGNIKALYE
jgi:hypothetical protein